MFTFMVTQQQLFYQGVKSHFSVVGLDHRPKLRWLSLKYGVLPRNVLQNNGALHFRSVSSNHSGVYRCIAKNKHGVAYSQVELNVIGRVFFH